MHGLIDGWSGWAGGEGGQELALGPGEGGLYGVKGGSGGPRKGWQGWDGVLVWLQSVPPDLTFSPSPSSSICQPIQGLQG